MAIVGGAIMTYSLSPSDLSFLDQRARFTVSEICANPTIVPDEPGIYGWWFDAAVLSAQSERTLSRDGLCLLYIGIAPKGPTEHGRKARTIRDRLKNHCRGRLCSSTLRRTLAALYAVEQGFEIARLHSGKPFMSTADERRLSDWMNEHAKIGFTATQEPWLIEAEILRAAFASEHCRIDEHISPRTEKASSTAASNKVTLMLR
jgi:hypothetical protein